MIDYKKLDEEMQQRKDRLQTINEQLAVAATYTDSFLAATEALKTLGANFRSLPENDRMLFPDPVLTHLADLNTYITHNQHKRIVEMIKAFKAFVEPETA